MCICFRSELPTTVNIPVDQPNGQYNHDMKVYDNKETSLTSFAADIVQVQSPDDVRIKLKSFLGEFGDINDKDKNGRTLLHHIAR